MRGENFRKVQYDTIKHKCSMGYSRMIDVREQMYDLAGSFLKIDFKYEAVTKWLLC